MEGISAVDFLSAISLNKLINCKYLRDLNANHNPGDVINGSFRIASTENTIESYNCGIHTELPEIISHQLHLNLSFVTPDYSYKDVNLAKFINNGVDYLANGVSMTDLLSDLNSIAASNYIFEDYYINFLVKKQSIRISLKNYYSLFSMLIWILLFAAIFCVGLIQGMKLILRKNENKKNIFKFILNLIFNYFNLMMSNQPSVLLHKILPRNYIMYFIPLLSIIVVNSMKESIYSNMILTPKQWCDTLECFAESNIRFGTLDEHLHDKFSAIQKDDQFKSISSRTTWYSNICEFLKIIIFLNCNFILFILVKIITTNLIDFINGDIVYIGRLSQSDTFMNFFREIAQKENQKNWLNSLQIDYIHEIKIVNKKHPKYKQIINIINISFENGFTQHWQLLYKQGTILLFYVLEKMQNPQLVDDIKNAINFKRTHITLDELVSVFHMLIICLLVSFVVFVIEIIYFYLFN